MSEVVSGNKEYVSFWPTVMSKKVVYTLYWIIVWMQPTIWRNNFRTKYSICWTNCYMKLVVEPICIYVSAINSFVLPPSWPQYYSRPLICIKTFHFVNYLTLLAQTSFYTLITMSRLTNTFLIIYQLTFFSRWQYSLNKTTIHHAYSPLK